MKEKISILICTFRGSEYLTKTIASINQTFPKNLFDFELFIDTEEEKTGIENTPNRYMELFKKSSGDIIVKSDDDVFYYRGWFERCYEILQKEKDIGYISPISHKLMVKEGIRHANSNRLPIENDGYESERILSGMCWIFHRILWEKIPYSLVASKTIYLDSLYSDLVHRHHLKTIAIKAGLIKHLGMTRFKGHETDRPGKPHS